MSKNPHPRPPATAPRPAHGGSSGRRLPPRKAGQAPERAAVTPTYVRFGLARRIEHLVMLLSFAALGLTGLTQKYSDADISIFLVNLLGGIELLRAVHHIAAIVMMLGTAWHLLVMGYQFFVLRSRMSMLPTLQDIKDGWQALMYNLGLARSYPQMGRFTFEEKLEYWSFVWGAIIMGLTGFLMWNPITATRSSNLREAGCGATYASA